jgi:branched-chain amino acid transport system ATP-binding protein
MLKLEQVHTHYGAVEALAGVSIEVNKGEIVTLIGSNGAGKTTLMMTVCGTPRVVGRVLFEGNDITAMSTHQIMRQGMAISPEGRRVFPSLTVLENLKMGGFFASRHEIDDGIEHVFKLFPRLKERAAQRAGTMSGGEQQMLAIGRALMSKPRLLLLDEPTLGLAPLVIAQIFDIIRTIRDEGVTVFLVEQNANKALGVADRGYVLETGASCWPTPARTCSRTTGSSRRISAAECTARRRPATGRRLAARGAAAARSHVPRRQPMKVKRIVANVDTQSVDDAKRFYQQIFGLDLLMDLGWIATYGSAERMRVQISFASQGGSGTPTPDLSIEVDDLDEALARIQAAGIAVEYGPADEPWGVRRFFVRDPFGKLVNVLVHR